MGHKAEFNADIKRIAVTKRPGQDGRPIRSLQVVLEADVGPLEDLAELAGEPVKVTVVGRQGSLV